MTRQELTRPPAHVDPSAWPNGRRRRSRRPVAAGLAILGIALVAAFGIYPLLDRGSPVVQVVDDVLDPGATSARTTGSAAATGVDGGDVPGAAATLDDDIPAITGLDPDLATAVRQAADDAAAEGINFWLTSGWRSSAFQQVLLDDAVQEYGSLEAARQHVSTPELSAHVSGGAVDVGPTEADYWLIEHGTDYGLCQVYANEIWHFELLTEPGGTCPELLPDASAG